MTRRSGRHTSHDSRTGYTLIVCDHCRADSDHEVIDALRAVVRRSAHGVLVIAGCVMGRLWCHARKATQPAGQLLLVQPCNAARQPLAPAIPIGPLRSPDDVDTVCAWLEQRPLSPNGLPLRLRAHQQGSSRN